VNVALVGAGYWGQKLLPKFLAAPQALVRVVCDIHAENRAAIQGKFPDLPTAASLEAVLADMHLDAVVIVTPPATHFSLAKAALAAGKHVWVEKPLALQLAEGRELVQLARCKRTVLFVDHTFLYDSAVTMIRAMICSGELSDIYHLFLQRLNLGRIKRDSNVWWNSAPHDLSILRYLVPADVEGVHMDAFPYLQSGIADMTVTTVRLAGGVSAHIYLSWLSPLKVASIVVVGSKGMLHYEGRFGKRALQFFDYTVAEPASVQDNVVPIPNFAAIETIAGGAEEPLALAAEAFVASIRSGVPAPSAGEYSQRVVELLEAGDQSAARRQ